MSRLPTKDWPTWATYLLCYPGLHTPFNYVTFIKFVEKSDCECILRVILQLYGNFIANLGNADFVIKIAIIL